MKREVENCNFEEARRQRDSQEGFLFGGGEGNKSEEERRTLE